MLSLMLMLSVGTVSLANDNPAKQPTLMNAAVSSESRRDDAMRRLASEPREVADIYAMLASRDKVERLRAYGDLSSSMKASLWTHQLLAALAEHPEFAEEQRAVLYDALDLFTPEFFEITPSNPNWQVRVDRPLRRIEQRARAAFGSIVTRQLFAQLGPDSSRQAGSVLPMARSSSSPATLPAAVADTAWPADLSLSEGEAAETYAALLEQDVSERRRSYRNMSGTTKAALWIHQLRSALQAHPEFTTAQRTIIHSALSLLAPDFFEIDSSSPRWIDRVDVPLRELMAQAKAEFGPQMARELFGELGPREVRQTGSGAIEMRPIQRLGRPAPTEDASGTTPTCQCNSWSDFCGSNSRCVQGGCYFTNVGCGFMWQYSCVGLCVEYSPPYG